MTTPERLHMIWTKRPRLYGFLCRLFSGHAPRHWDDRQDLGVAPLAA